MVDLAFGATAMASIFAIVDPVGWSPSFLSLTEDPPSSRSRTSFPGLLDRHRGVGVFAVFGQ